MKIEKSNKLILVTSICLIGIICILAYSNLNNMNKQLSMNENGITIELNSESVKMFSQKEIYDLDSQEIEVTQNTNFGPPTSRNLTGVSIKEILLLSNINLEKIEEVTITALDGFSATYTIEEILQDDKIYVVYKEDGKKLEDNEGNYKIVCRDDKDSTRWLKQVYKINGIEKNVEQ